MNIIAYNTLTHEKHEREITSNIFTIGQEDISDLKLLSSSIISPKYAIITYTEKNDEYIIQNVGLRSIIVVDDKPISTGNKMPIIRGQEIYIGEWKLFLDCSGPARTGIAYEFKEGAIVEDYPWKIIINERKEVGRQSYNDPFYSDFTTCKHCHFFETKERLIGGCHPPDAKERVTTCIIPAQIAAINEGGCNGTSVCLDCVIEAYEKIKLLGKE